MFETRNSNSGLEGPPDRKANRPLLLEEEGIDAGLRSGVWVPREYQPERDIDYGHLDSNLAAHAVSVVVKESAGGV